jgi:hypothetical protein
VSLESGGRRWNLYEAAYGPRPDLVRALLAAGASASATLGEAFPDGLPRLDLTVGCPGGPKPGYGPDTDALGMALESSYSVECAEVVRILIAHGARIGLAHLQTYVAEMVPGPGWTEIQRILAPAARAHGLRWGSTPDP